MQRLALAILAGLIGLTASTAEAQKLYRWTDKDGKVHYSDHVPPEAVENARDELNSRGMKVGEVDRALTGEELAEEKERRRIEAEQREIEQAQAEKDEMLLNSYGSVAELDRAYTERFDLVDQSIESAKMGIESQQKSLAALVAHAAGLEQQGKPVPANIKSSIDLARSQVAQQRDYMAKREADRVELQAEFDAIRNRYLALKAKRAEPSGP